MVPTGVREAAEPGTPLMLPESSLGSQRVFAVIVAQGKTDAVGLGCALAGYSGVTGQRESRGAPGIRVEPFLSFSWLFLV